MLRPFDVLVAVPAHDEQDRIVSCLECIWLAAQHARQTGWLRHVRVVVGAHRCSDGTLEVASRYLNAHRDLHGLVHVDTVSENVGGVRQSSISAAVQAWKPAPAQTWIFNTDADSCPPPSWIAATLQLAHGSGAAAVAGLVEIDEWNGNEAGKTTYAQIVAAGIRPDSHDHVYAANLAVRLDAYLTVGGFESVLHGEDHELLRRLRDSSWPVMTSFEPVVRTSGRIPGRAPHGLGTLLASLAGADAPRSGTGQRVVGTGVV